ncbi:hypothetical protein T02_12750 [Trichinella nativa]|uniref:Uncharacterized protein n=1 Tax=Trichinella nativa TaxID=6335 RepID=A0A0V1KQJ1_9BILA|nr:hypothetical protein T02_12750 [Trichinella nativa]
MSSGKCEAGSQAEMTVGGNPSVDTGSSSLIDELARNRQSLQSIPVEGRQVKQEMCDFAEKVVIALIF